MSSKLQLPLLRGRRSALETCGYCPKLCRAACPVSNAEPRDTLTPWGKMSTAWYAARGDVAVDPAFARPSWACTGCFACRERCDHRNPVVDTLYDARADFYEAQMAPPAAYRVVKRHRERVRAADGAVAALHDWPGVDPAAPRAMLVGCGYLLDAPDDARDALDVVVTLAGRVRLVRGCCGAPLLQAGARAEYFAARREMEARLGNAELIVVDPGCAMALRDFGPVTLVELAARERSRLGRVPELGDEPVRWQDPCQLGRGLGRYDEPRAVLERALGRPAEEFARSREMAVCSGAGGLLPVTMPRVSRAIADARVAEHERLGGGTIVTGCSGSGRRLRATGARVVDIARIVRRALDHG